MSIKAILFDMDGLIFDTESVADKAARKACLDMGTVLTDDILQHLYGANYKRGEIMMKKKYGEDFDYAKYKRIMRKYMEEALAQEDGLRFLPGAKELIAWLKQTDYKKAIASSSTMETINRFLDRMGLVDSFDFIIGGDMVVDSKPAPDIFKKAAESLGVPVENCLVLEDSYNGIRSGSSAGCIVGMVPNMVKPNEEIEKLCFAIFSSLNDVPGFISQYNNGEFDGKETPIIYPNN